jgi:hypothetical protein
VPICICPYTDDDYEEMKKIKVGSIVKANIVRPRNIKFHRKFFSLIRAAWDCLTEQQRTNLRSIDTFREQLLITSGFSEPLYDLNGQKFLERAKSISFAKMDFHTLYIIGLGQGREVPAVDHLHIERSAE